MGQTLALNGAPTMAAHDSGDIVVGGSPVAVFAYSGLADFGYDFVAFVDRKVGANWIPEANDKGVTHTLTKARPSIGLFLPGTYRLRKAATPGVVGFGKDEV